MDILEGVPRSLIGVRMGVLTGVLNRGSACLEGVLTDVCFIGVLEDVLEGVLRMDLAGVPLWGVGG